MNTGYWPTISPSEKKDLMDEIMKTHENVLANPPLEMLDRGVNQWVDLCNHLNSNKFKKASSANIGNRSKKYNHRTGSRPFSYIVEKMTELVNLFGYQCDVIR
ncbi:Hypothetical predicted protein [Olea europaea subsp. europaea]|uniref:Uncharacterized protein n=1 Tax=Olea europaea subsp. europaea TaxID=158383 RepID=A0A8S0SHV5_OLEEU|nr:Hypothetical predicted protein [Olea europaea subsp. europaea]